MRGRLTGHLHRRWPLWLIAAWSYIPLIVIGPRTLNADTKLYLGEDPWGLITRSAFAWDSSQFAGFIPHQSIAYIWPSGPFYWLADLVGSPQWLTQRLWLGTIFFAASVGVHVLLRHMSFTTRASLIASAVFCFSPYVLSYQSRTSAMLLPWAAVAWLTYFTHRGIRSRAWLWPALIAVTIATVGAVNATATLLVLPAPILMAVHMLTRSARPGEVLAFAWRTAVLTIGANIWWITMLAIQSRHGADVLTYTETLESVSSTANAFEVLRSMGYWLNYAGLDDAPMTTAAVSVLDSPIALIATAALPTIAIVTLALTRHSYRTLALWWALVGAVLAVGVHPLGESMPIFSSLADDPTSTLALALRSSTRAIPVLLLALAVGLALCCDAPWWARLRPGAGWTPIAVLGLLVIMANPTRLTDGVVDPSLERSPIPTTWRELGTVFDTGDDPDTRVLQVPGQEFGAYTWGTTIDPALPAVTNASLLTRDLVPLGSEPVMDLVWAIDEAIREGRLTEGSIAHLARMMASQIVFFPSDLDNERYGTPTQDLVIASNGLSDSAALDVIDSSGHRFLFVDDVAQIRQRPGTTLLLGDAKGIVDAAIADVLGQDAVLLAGDVTDPMLPDIAARIGHVVVTDTNTEHGQHWRSSLDNRGFDEDRDGLLTNLGSDIGDIRMRIFSKERDDDRTWFEQSGPVRARASSYGPPLSFRPEHRPFAAIDGDPTTAWTVAHGFEALAPVLVVTTDQPVSVIEVLQPQFAINRAIDRISISVDGGPWTPFTLGDRSLTTAQAIELPESGTSIALRIDATRMLRTPRAGEELSGVGFAEVATGLEPTREIGLLPTRGLEFVSDQTPITYVMTRRVAPLGRELRSDIEEQWSRRFFLPTTSTVTLTARIDGDTIGTASADEVVAALLARSPVTIDDRMVNLSLSPSQTAGSITFESEPIRLDAGSHEVSTTTVIAPIDQVVITTDPDRIDSPIVPTNVEASGLVSKRVVTSPCPQGCWLVFGQGFNSGWSARSETIQLGEAIPIEGGSHGWWIEPTNVSHTITLTFTPQRALNVAWMITVLFVSAIIAILVFNWRLRRRPDRDPEDFAMAPTMAARHPMRVALVASIVTVITFGALFDWRTAVLAMVVVAVVSMMRAWTDRWRYVSIVAGLTMAVAMTTSVWSVIAADPPLDFDWVDAGARSHHLLLATLATLACAALLDDARLPPTPEVMDPTT